MTHHCHESCNKREAAPMPERSTRSRFASTCAALLVLCIPTIRSVKKPKRYCRAVEWAAAVRS
jgi:hypothetical protein